MATTRIAHYSRGSTGCICTLALCLALIAGCANTERRDVKTSYGSLRKDRPNVVLVLLDDLELEGLRFMPRAIRLIGDSGVTFDRAFVSASLCCPSRVSLLRGQYPHNSGVVSNGGSNGGFQAAYAKGVERSTLASWLSDVGYRTALYGKYLNFYPANASETYIPPGWTDWGVPVSGRPYHEFDYALNINKRIRKFGHKAKDYGTDVYVDLSEEFVRRSVSQGDPFFLLLAPFAPHFPAAPAPRHAKLFADATIPESPSRREEDMSDKPPLMRDLPFMAPQQVAKITQNYRQRLRSLQAVDEGVERLVGVLRELGELESTVFIVTSDNGFHLLDHRLPQGKDTPYETDIRVPLLVRGPGIPRGVHRSELVLNSDIAPTIAELAGAPIPDFVDGRSMAKLLRGSETKPWREGFLVMRRLPEGLQLPSGAGVGEYPDALRMAPESAAVRRDGKPYLYPPAARKALAMIVHYPHYDAVRSNDDWSFIRHDGGFVELYNLKRDPYQLENLAVTEPTDVTRQMIKRFSELTDALLECKGKSCAEVEDDAHVR
jgi:N-acetylglucosamine-6-sulfatase